jgi:tetratricopeptide (TPR) repeat protein
LEIQTLRRTRSKKVARRETSGSSRASFRALKERKNFFPRLQRGKSIADLFQTFHVWLLSQCHFVAENNFQTVSYWALTSRFVWIAFLGGWCAIESSRVLWQKFQSRRDENLQHVFSQAREAIAEKDFQTAQNLLTRILSEAHADRLKQEARYSLVIAYTQAEDFANAEKEMKVYEILYGVDPYLKGLFHFHKKEMEQAIPHLRESFAEQPLANTGLLLFNSLIETNSFSEALELCEHPALIEIKRTLYLYLQNKAFYGEAFMLSAEVGQRAFELQNNAGVAYNIACAFARLDKTAEGLKWLALAVENGFNDKNALASDSDIDALRSSPEFEEIVKKVATES